MPSLGSLFYSLGIRDLTDADLQKINAKLKNLGFNITLTPKILKDLTQSAVPKGIKIELDPTIKNEALARAVEGKVMRVAVTPLLTGFREAIVRATRENPPQAEVGVSAERLRTIIQSVLNRHGFMINISTVNDNYTKVVQQMLNGRVYKIKIHADAKEITQSVQASLMQVQSRAFGLRVSRGILYRSIDEALGQKRFNINIAVSHDQARRAVQDALLRAQVIGKDQALAYQRLQTGEMRAAQAELLRLKAAHGGAADAAKVHASASLSLGGAMGSNIKIAGELGSAMASMYSIHAAKEFLMQVVEIGGELEHQKIAMDTIFGDKGKTNELFGQIKGLARQSPFGVMELSKSVKALSAYGVEYNEIYDTAKRLADISAATSVDINRLILAFGKTKSRTFLDGLEAKQFAYANIPIYDLLSKKLTELEGHYVSIGEVMERQKKRQIGFDLVKDVLWEQTDPGGKFYNMQEALAGSVKTSWKLVRDNIELMFGEIAESSVGGAMKSTFQLLQQLTRNWRTVGAVIAAVAVTFGIYKAAVLASNIVMGQANAASLRTISTETSKQASLARTAALYRKLTNAEYDNIIAETGLNRARKLSIFSRRLLTKAEMESLYMTSALNKDMLMRLAATGRLQKGALALMRQTGLLTYSDMRYLAQLRTTTTFMGIHGKVASAMAVRFNILGNAISNAAKKLGAFIFNPAMAAMAAIGTAVAIWSKNSQENENAEQFGKDLQTKGEGAAKSIGEALKRNVNVSGQEAKQLLEEYRNLIKDYSATPDSIINNSIFDDNGNIRNTAEQIKYLREQLEMLKDTADDMANKDGDMFVKSTNNGPFDDDVSTDVKDWDKTRKNTEATYLRFVSDNKKLVQQMVEAAAQADASYSNATYKMQTLNEKFAELMNNREKYAAAYKAASEVSDGKLDESQYRWYFKSLNWTPGIIGLGNITNEFRLLREKLGMLSVSEQSDVLKRDTKEMEKEIGELAEAFKTATEDWDYNNLKPSQVEFARQYWDGLMQQFGIVAPEQKQKLQKIFSDAIGIDIQGLDGQSLIANEIKKGGETYLSKELLEKVEAGLAVTPEEQQQVDNAIKNAYLKLFNEAKKNKDLWLERALNSAVGTGGRYNKAKLLRVKAMLDLSVDMSDDWQREIYKKLEGNQQIKVWLTASSDTLSFVKAAKEGYAAAKTTIDGLKPLMLKAGIGFEPGKKIPIVTKEYQNMTPQQQKMVDEYNAAIEAIDAAMKAGKEMGFDPAAEYNKGNKNKNKGGKGKQTDKVAEDLKQRFKDIKDAWSEFQKWSATEGKIAAATRIGDSGLFSTLSKDKIPQTVEEYRTLVAGLESELRKAGVKGHKERESLLNDLLKQLLDIDKTIVDEQLKLALDKVSKEAERQIADWNLFDKIRKATGNKNLAMSIAFGLNADGETDFPTMIKRQLKQTVDAAEAALSKAVPKDGESPYKAKGYTYDQLKKLYDARDTDKGIKEWMDVPEEIRKAWEKANGDILKYFDQQRDAVVDILTKYQSLQDKIAKIDSDRNEEIRKINESKDLTPEQKAQTIQRINVEADYEIFTKSNEYLQFFNDIYGLTMDEANRIGDLIQLNLNQKLQAGLITIYDYEKEMEKVRKQLESLRNVKSDAMTFFTSGLKGLNKKWLQKAEGELANNEDYQKALADQIAAQNALNEAKEKGNKEAIAAAEAQLALANQSVKAFTKIRDAIIADQEKMQNVLDVANIAANIAGGLSNAFNSIRDMADAFGVDTESNGWLNVEGVLDALTSVTGGVQKVVQSAMNGDIGGILSGVVSTITSPFTIWAKLHDKKLQKVIERSKEAAQILQDQYDIIEKRMAHFLGNAANMAAGNFKGNGDGGAYGAQLELMKGQLNELYKQRDAEMDKKKKDKSVIRDYDKQIEEMKITIRDFAEEVANTVYGIDLNGWAQQLGDSLVDAFSKGEDAAEAFDKTVSDIMRDVTSKMIAQDILAPMFGDLRNFLFGENDKSGAFGADFKLDASEVAAMKEYLDKIKNQGIPAAEELFNAINSATGGLLDDIDKAKSGLSAGIQGVTEDTADLLASYINAMRADLSVQVHDYWPRLLEMVPQISAVSQSQLDAQRQIAENTLRNAVAAEMIVQYSKSIDDRLRRAQSDKSTGFWMK